MVGWVTVRLPAAVLLAAPQPGEDDPDSTGQGAEWGKAAPVGLLVILLLCVAAVFLFRSFNRQLKKVPASFDADPPAVDGPAFDGSASGYRVPAAGPAAPAAAESEADRAERDGPAG